MTLLIPRYPWSIKGYWRCIYIPSIFKRKKKINELIVPVAVNLYDKDVVFVNFIDKLNKILTKDDEDNLKFKNCMDFILEYNIKLNTYKTEFKLFIESQDLYVLVLLFDVITQSLHINVNENNKLVLNEISTVLCNRELINDDVGFDLYESIITCISRINHGNDELIKHLNAEFCKNVTYFIKNGMLVYFIDKLCYILQPNVIYTFVFIIQNKLDTLDVKDLIKIPNLFKSLKISNKEFINGFLHHSSYNVKKLFKCVENFEIFLNDLLLLENTDPKPISTYLKLLDDNLNDPSDISFTLASLPESRLMKSLETCGQIEKGLIESFIRKLFNASPPSSLTSENLLNFVKFLNKSNHKCTENDYKIISSQLLNLKCSSSNDPEIIAELLKFSVKLQSFDYKNAKELLNSIKNHMELSNSFNWDKFLNFTFHHTVMNSLAPLIATKAQFFNLNTGIKTIKYLKFIPKYNIRMKTEDRPPEVTNTVGLTESSPPEVQSDSLRLADSSSNYLSLKSIATPGDRGGSEGNDWTSSGLPAADLREAEGELNREATTPSGKTSSVEADGRTPSGGTPSRRDDVNLSYVGVDTYELPENDLLYSFISSMYDKFTTMDNVEAIDNFIKILSFSSKVGYNSEKIDVMVDNLMLILGDFINFINIDSIFKLPIDHKIISHVYELYDNKRINRLSQLIEFYFSHCNVVLSGNKRGVEIDLDSITENICQIICKLDKTIEELYINRCFYNPKESTSKVNAWKSTELRLLINKPIEPYDLYLDESIKSILYGNEDNSYDTIDSLLSLRRWMMKISTKTTDLELKVLLKSKYTDAYYNLKESLSKFGGVIRQCLLTISMNMPTLRDINLPKKHMEVVINNALKKLKNIKYP